MFSACCYLDLTTLVYRKDHNESLLSPLYSFMTRKVMKSEKWKDKWSSLSAERDCKCICKNSFHSAKQERKAVKESVFLCQVYFLFLVSSCSLSSHWQHWCHLVTPRSPLVSPWILAAASRASRYVQGLLQPAEVGLWLLHCGLGEAEVGQWSLPWHGGGDMLCGSLPVQCCPLGCALVTCTVWIGWVGHGGTSFWGPNPKQLPRGLAPQISVAEASCGAHLFGFPHLLLAGSSS